MSKLLLLDLMGGVALLLWGLHMVRTGVLRAFGTGLRRVLRQALRNRGIAFLVGLGVTTIVQSSTATALLASSFTESGVLALVPALALMLGANVGTSLVVQIMSFDISFLAPLFIVVGVLAFNTSSKTRLRDLGRVAIGLGLMLLSLHILVDTLAPAELAPNFRAIIQSLTGFPILNVLLGAALAWASHSSLAVVILTGSLSFSSFVTPEAALALVLGANLGSAINPLMESGNSDNPASRRLPVGNLANRVLGCAVALPFLHEIAEGIRTIDPNPARFVADFHTAFNVVLALLFLVPLDAIAWLLTRALPDRKPVDDPGAPLYLDEAAISSPPVALACAAREVLHAADIVETMLRQSVIALMSDDRKLVAEISRMDNAVDQLDQAIKLYVTKITREQLEGQDAQRATEIIAFTINLEHIGDIIDKNLMELAAKKIKRKLSFSKEGAAELAEFHRRVVDNLKLAQSVFMSGDTKVARRLLEEKVVIRDLERAAADNHLARLRDGRPESIETSSLHLDVLRDLKRIHSHICAVAYPVLEAAGELQPSRLKRKSHPRRANTRVSPRPLSSGGAS